MRPAPSCCVKGTPGPRPEGPSELIQWGHVRPRSPQEAPMQITDKVFVVTGGRNGIGREVALGLLERGARVAALDLRAEALEGLVEAATAPEGRLSVHTVDVSSRDDVT